MSNDLLALYTSMLELPVLDPVFQAHILDWGTGNSRHTLLAGLAAHPSLTQEMDDALAKIPAHSVQAAWVARPGRSVAELTEKATKDKRVAVQALLAQLDCLPDAAYEALAKAKSPKVAFPLAENEAVPIKYRLKAVETISDGASSRSSYALSARYREMFDPDSPLIDALVTSFIKKGNTGNEMYSIVFKNTTIIEVLEPETIKLMVADLIARSEQAARQVASHLANSVQRNQYSTQRLVSSASVPLSYLATLAERGDVPQEAAIPLVGLLSQTPPLDSSGELKALLSETRPRFDLLLEEINAMDTPELLEFAKNFAPEAGPGQDIITAIIASPAADIAVVNAAITHWSKIKESQSLDIARLARARQNDSVVLARLAETTLEYGFRGAIDDDILDATPDPASVLRAVIKKGSVPPWVLRSKHVTDAIAADTPVSRNNLLRAHYAHVEETDRFRKRVFNHIQSSLGSSPRAWAMFADLYEGFPGSYNDLIDQIQILISAEG